VITALRAELATPLGMRFERGTPWGRKSLLLAAKHSRGAIDAGRTPW
jgi:hypothetical protein